jgi:hypothetical protein
MIFIGYPGVGKSTLVAAPANKKLGFIDLESSCMWYKDKNNVLQRHSNWAEIYVNIAEDLSRQGFMVFVSSHAAVVDELKKRETPFTLVYPHQSLKDEWIERLKKRYVALDCEKNAKAYINVRDHFSEQIEWFDSLECDNRIVIMHADESVSDYIKPLA